MLMIIKCTVVQIQNIKKLILVHCNYNKIRAPPTQAWHSRGLPDCGHATGTSIFDNRRQHALHYKLTSWFVSVLWSILKGCRRFLCWVESAISDPVRLLASMAAIHDVFTKLATLANWLNWLWAESHILTFHSCCSIVFQKNMYMNLACFLYSCKIIMEFMLTVKNYKAPLSKLPVESTCSHQD